MDKKEAKEKHKLAFKQYYKAKLVLMIASNDLLLAHGFTINHDDNITYTSSDGTVFYDIDEAVDWLQYQEDY